MAAGEVTDGVPVRAALHGVFGYNTQPERAVGSDLFTEAGIINIHGAPTPAFHVVLNHNPGASAVGVLKGWLNKNKDLSGDGHPDLSLRLIRKTPTGERTPQGEEKIDVSDTREIHLWDPATDTYKKKGPAPAVMSAMGAGMKP